MDDAAQAMRALKPEERDLAIAAATNCLDARELFFARMKITDLQRAYRKPKAPPPGGVA